MKARLGVYSKNDDFDAEMMTINGVDHQEVRLNQLGGNLQQERMIRDKRRSLDRAVWNSYQAAQIRKIDAEDQTPVRALINPDKLSQDYDIKTISIGFEYDVKPGAVFEWVGTNTYWLVYLQDLTELAYFRGDIRKCSYTISWQDEDGLHTTYAAVRGPVETKINSAQKHNIIVDTPNYSLNMIMPKNEETLKYFNRYSKFYLQGNDTCWRVEAIDEISSPGILEVVALEYYSNKDEDDIDAGIVGALIPEKEDPNKEDSSIIGDTFIKVKKTYQYEFNGTEIEMWKVDKNIPVILNTDPNNPKRTSLKWDSSYSGQFDLYYGNNYFKTIVVESLF